MLTYKSICGVLPLSCASSLELVAYCFRKEMIKYFRLKLAQVTNLLLSIIRQDKIEDSYTLTSEMVHAVHFLLTYGLSCIIFLTLGYALYTPSENEVASM